MQSRDISFWRLGETRGDGRALAMEAPGRPTASIWSGGGASACSGLPRGDGEAVPLASFEVARGDISPALSPLGVPRPSFSALRLARRSSSARCSLSICCRIDSRRFFARDFLACNARRARNFLAVAHIFGGARSM